MKHCLTLKNYSQDEIYKLLSKALEFKRQKKLGKKSTDLAGKTVALIFKKPSTRTRISFETAIAQLGGHPVYLTEKDMQLGRGETVSDTAKVLSRYVDAIIIRTFQHEEVEQLAQAASVPVINALTDLHHPCQALADLMTILENKNRLSGINLTYIGDGNNVCHSLLMAAAKVGINFTAACPAGYEPNADWLAAAEQEIRGRHRINITNDPKKAAKGADVLYTDVWTSMGQEEEKVTREKTFAGYQINADLIRAAKRDVIVMHCLPAYRDKEISSEVIDGPHSVIFEQAENRLYINKALLLSLINEQATASAAY